MEVATDDEISIAITSFTPTKGKMFYTIETKSTLPLLKASQAKVARNYDEFSWLHARLIENQDNVGVIVPSLPGKAILADQAETEGKGDLSDASRKRSPIEQRAERLQRWLMRVARHSILRQDLNFRTFLEFSDLKVKSEGFSLTGLFKTEDSGKNDPRAEFQEARSFTAEYRKRIPAAVVAAKAMCNAAHDLGHHGDALLIGEFESALGDVDVLKILKPSLPAAKACLKWAEAMTSVGDSQLYDLLQDHHDDIDAAWNMHQRRLALVSALDSATKATAKAKAAALQKPSDANVKASTEKKAAEDDLTQRLQNASELALKEVQIARKYRFEHFKTSITTYAEYQIRLSSELAKTLEATLKGLYEAFEQK